MSQNRVFRIVSGERYLAMEIIREPYHPWELWIHVDVQNVCIVGHASLECIIGRKEIENLFITSSIFFFFFCCFVTSYQVFIRISAFSTLKPRFLYHMKVFASFFLISYSRILILFRLHAINDQSLHIQTYVLEKLPCQT